jgi:hypothetical protein
VRAQPITAWPQSRTGLNQCNPRPVRSSHGLQPHLRAVRAQHGALGPGRAQSACLVIARGGSLAANRRPGCARVQTHATGRRLARRGPKHRLWTDHVEVHMARAEAADNWTACEKVSIGRIHGPRRTCLTQSKALDHSEKGGRRRCGAHRHGRRRRSSTTVKVSVLRVME